MGSEVSDVKAYISEHKTQLKTALDKLKRKEKLKTEDERVLDGLRESAGFSKTASRKDNSGYLRNINEALKDEFKGYTVSNTYSTPKRLKRESEAGKDNCRENLAYDDDWELNTPHKPKPHLTARKPKARLATPRPKPAKPEASKPELKPESILEEEPEAPAREVKKTVREEPDTMNDLSGFRGSISARERAEDDDGPSPWLFALGALGASLGNIAGCFNRGGGCYPPQPCFGGGGCVPPPRCGGGPFQIGPVYYTDGDTWPWGRMPPGINLGGGGFGCGTSYTSGGYNSAGF